MYTISCLCSDILDIFLQDLEKYAGPDAVREWRKLLASIMLFYVFIWLRW